MVVPSCRGMNVFLRAIDRLLQPLRCGVQCRYPVSPVVRQAPAHANGPGQRLLERNGRECALGKVNRQQRLRFVGGADRHGGGDSARTRRPYRRG